MSKTICEMSAKQRKNEMKKKVRFECRSCGYQAKKKKKVCKPEKI